MPKSKSHARHGADAAFAKAMARAEFGRFYCDDRDLQEVRRSLTRSKQSSELPRPSRPADGTKPECGKPVHAPKENGKLWRPVGVRERRTELQAGLARLKRARTPPS